MVAKDDGIPRTKGGQFAKGVSGNPAGKRPGTRHKATQAVEKLLDGEAQKLTRKAVDLALAGDTVALRLCLERIAAPRRDRPVAFDLPSIETIEDHPKALAAVMHAVAAGELTPSEAEGFARVVETHRRTFEIVQFETRLRTLEADRGK